MWPYVMVKKRDLKGRFFIYISPNFGQ